MALAPTDLVDKKGSPITTWQGYSCLGIYGRAHSCPQQDLDSNMLEVSQLELSSYISEWRLATPIRTAATNQNAEMRELFQKGLG